ncbi:unnamed protein product [marine sediment metagenome]|uniref:Class I SAM-dependent methyltransferase n=1 Tax=marine sediment metagenome TaxID=412755 RepID=X1MK38_9ZZZZ
MLIANNSLDFVYIDGSHTYESVAEDIILYYPKLKKGGLLSGHDYRKHTKGVIIAVNEFCKKNALDLHREGKLDWWAWK